MRDELGFETLERALPSVFEESDVITESVVFKGTLDSSPEYSHPAIVRNNVKTMAMLRKRVFIINSTFRK